MLLSYLISRQQKLFIFGLILLTWLLLASQPVTAQTSFFSATPAAEVITPTDIASSSTGLTNNPNLAASDSAQTQDIKQKIQELQKSDITVTQIENKDKLQLFLESNPPQSLSWNNFLEHSIRNAVNLGVPANIVVLVILFPLIASIIAAGRHIIGLRGFGIYIPAVLSVVLVSTGLISGIVIFISIVAAAITARKFLKKFRLPYLPRTALMLWVVSLGILVMLTLAPYLKLIDIMRVNIYSILILVLLSENFLDAQASTKPADALALAIETIGLAFVSGFILRWEYLQQLALIEPELILIFTIVINFAVGRFTGLRVSEWLRFRPIIEE